jgi:hypothetical protein
MAAPLLNIFCDFRNYQTGLDVFDQETEKATGLKEGKKI